MAIARRVLKKRAALCAGARGVDVWEVRQTEREDVQVAVAGRCDEAVHGDGAAGCEEEGDGG